MQLKISGQLLLPTSKRQKLLHHSAGQYLTQLSRRKDAAEVQQDSLQSAPQGMLPMVF